MIPDATNEWIHENEYDAAAIASMAENFRAMADQIDSLWSAWRLTGPHPTAGQIDYCWENPDAWEILAGDVDRGWFMEQVATRTSDIPPVV